MFLKPVDPVNLMLHIMFKPFRVVKKLSILRNVATVRYYFLRVNSSMY